MAAVITLQALAELFETYRAEAAKPVERLRVGDRTFDVDARPSVMGCVNLSRDSTYRESIATSAESAVRKGRVQAAQGADFIDIGAESSTAKASRVGADDQTLALVPVVQQLSSEGILVSVETYEPAVARAGLTAGAQIVNFTGAAHEAAIFDLVAEHQATLVLCYVTGENVREITDVELDGDPFPELHDHFGRRVEDARSRGVDRIVIDPGMGFYYGNLVDPEARVRHQTRVLLNSIRLRVLGLPICHALPHAFDLFEDQFRSAEGLFAVLAHLGGAGVFRTHEVPQVVAVLDALRVLSVD
jgi:dihydropteroate synthase